jgi:predicted AlkP superfamily pyrophosphatase or phosphodiesterase
MQLGQQGHPDFLGVSLSTTDAIGHRYGPGSLEIHDQILRLDRQLGWFLDSLLTVIPVDRLVISLTADHGSTEYPEAGGGERFSLSDEVRQLRDWARDRWNIDIDIAAESGLVLADTAALAARGVAIDSLATALRQRVIPRRGVRDVVTPTTLASRTDREAELWRRQIPPGTGWLIGVAIDPGWVHGSSTSSTGHGSTNLTDRRVPILIMAPGVPPQRIERPVEVVDLAPTIAALIGVTPTEPLDGRIIPEIVSSRR